ncbi:hypothetical protein DFH09DRAFT_1336734 [Mycena vulgaris]|nr:hypothetical protein DFH09DRAFT_1336734 [Mycena vulgaris]
MSSPEETNSTSGPSPSMKSPSPSTRSPSPSPPEPKNPSPLTKSPSTASIPPQLDYPTVIMESAQPIVIMEPVHLTQQTRRAEIPTYIPLGTRDVKATDVWSIYTTLAEEYDKVMVESWRDDMQGILIFAGLFSATVTAFLIESYKGLNADAGDTAVLLLTQISRQLEAGLNGTGGALASPPVPRFVPSTSSLICNTLWFISLGLSLSCALIALLLGQWARDFLHKVEIRSAPVIRGRILSYLYYGIRRFDMHVVVEVVPFLIHASLFIFLAGLVVFLIPVNIVVMVVSAVVLATLVAVYSTLTILPIIHFDCPYRTPLTATVWKFLQFIRSFSVLYHVLPGVGNLTKTPPARPTMMDTMIRLATANSDERAARDCSALGWTIKSLIDDRALQSFVQFIPGILAIDKSKPQTSNPYQKHFSMLIHDKNVQISLRIEGMLRSSVTGNLDWEDRVKRQFICFNAMWAILRTDTTVSVIQDQTLIETAYGRSDFETGLLPLVVFSRYRTFRVSLEGEMLDTLNYLNACRAQVLHHRLPDITSVRACITKTKALIFDHPEPFTFKGLLQPPTPPNLSSISEWIDKAITLIQTLRIDIPYLLLLRYLECCAEFSQLPLKHFLVLNGFLFPTGVPSSAVLLQYEKALGNGNPLRLRPPSTDSGPRIRYPTYATFMSGPRIETFRSATALWLETPLRNIIVSVPRPILDYFDQIASPENDQWSKLEKMITQVGWQSLWSCICTDIPAVEPEDTLFVTAVLHLWSCEMFHAIKHAMISPRYMPTGTLNAALSAIESARSPWMFGALTAAIKFTALIFARNKAFRSQDDAVTLRAVLQDPALDAGVDALPLPAAPLRIYDDSTNISSPQEQSAGRWEVVKDRCTQAGMLIVVELLESYPTSGPVVPQLPDIDSISVSPTAYNCFLPLKK